MKITNKAYAMLFVGQKVAAEIEPSQPDLRAWVSVNSFLKGKTIYGPEGDRPYRGVGVPSFWIHKFEVRESSLEPGYEYDISDELLNEQRVTITHGKDIDKRIEQVEGVLESWGIDPSKLGPPGDEYPL